MKPAEFKSRFISTLPEIPPGIDLRLDEFFRYPELLVKSLPIPEDQRRILTVSGLPKDAAPFLSFGVEPERCLERMGAVYGLSGEFDRYRILGFNSSGDMICIDEQSGRIVYLNHDNKMEIVYMNLNACSLAIALCAFGEFMKRGNADACRTTIREADPQALEFGNFWAFEIENQANDRFSF